MLTQSIFIRFYLVVADAMLLCHSWLTALLLKEFNEFARQFSPISDIISRLQICIGRGWINWSCFRFLALSVTGVLGSFMIECWTLCNYASNYVGYYFVITLHYFIITLLGLTLPIITIYILFF